MEMGCQVGNSDEHDSQNYPEDPECGGGIFRFRFLKCLDTMGDGLDSREGGAAGSKATEEDAYVQVFDSRWVRSHGNILDRRAGDKNSIEPKSEHDEDKCNEPVGW